MLAIIELVVSFPSAVEAAIDPVQVSEEALLDKGFVPPLAEPAAAEPATGADIDEPTAEPVEYACADETLVPLPLTDVAAAAAELSMVVPPVGFKIGELATEVGFTAPLELTEFQFRF